MLPLQRQATNQVHKYFLAPAVILDCFIFTFTEKLPERLYQLDTFLSILQGPIVETGKTCVVLLRKGISRILVAPSSERFLRQCAYLFIGIYSMVPYRYAC
jgi:hypothetical protein